MTNPNSGPDPTLDWRRRYRLYGIWISCLWVVVALVAITAAVFIFYDQNRQEAARLQMLEARVSDLSQAVYGGSPPAQIVPGVDDI